MKIKSFYKLQISYHDAAGYCRTHDVNYESEDECHEEVKNFAKNSNIQIYHYSIDHLTDYWLDD